MVKKFSFFQRLLVWIQSLWKPKVDWGQSESENIILSNSIEQEWGEPGGQMENYKGVPRFSLGEKPLLDRILTPEASQWSIEISDTDSIEGNSGRLASKRSERNLEEHKTSNSDAVDHIPLNLNINLNKDLNPPLGYARLIGKGGFASVFKSNYLNIPVAIKQFNMEHQMPLNDRQKDAFQHELSIISQLDHKNIVKFFGACQQPGNRALVMEYVESNLFQMMDNMRYNNTKNNTDRKFSTSNIFKIIKAIACALEYLHSRKIVHKDLHPWNVLVTKDGCVKVADVGISKVLQHSISNDTKKGGIFGYLAPEIFQGLVHRKSDIFSLGIIAWELFTLDKTWVGLGEGLLCHKILSGERPDIPDDMPQNLRNLITSCWHQDYNRRPSGHDVVKTCENQLKS